jgi:formamidopyrimidine-DNA glycosylase
MPELPEVEVTRQGIAAHITGRKIESVTIRNRNLRWPIPDDLAAQLTGSTVQTVARRGKFILIDCQRQRVHGTLLIHLGMTGTLRIVPAKTPLRSHDHVDIRFQAGPLVRFNDPRRFGAMLWHDPARDGPIETSRHLAGLGVEPLTSRFAGDAGGELLFRASRGKTLAVKAMLLAGGVVVGVGNIYCSEALFRAKVNPRTAAGRISRQRYTRLANAIRETLDDAINRGGSTLRDFVSASGAPGYFQQDYFVYGRDGLPCLRCGSTIRIIRQGQRSTFYCPSCQAR